MLRKEQMWHALFLRRWQVKGKEYYYIHDSDSTFAEYSLCNRHCKQCINIIFQVTQLQCTQLMTQLCDLSSFLLFAQTLFSIYTYTVSFNFLVCEYVSIPELQATWTQERRPVLRVWTPKLGSLSVSFSGSQIPRLKKRQSRLLVLGDWKQDGVGGSTQQRAPQNLHSRAAG